MLNYILVDFLKTTDEDKILQASRQKIMIMVIITIIMMIIIIHLEGKKNLTGVENLICNTEN